MNLPIPANTVCQQQLLWDVQVCVVENEFLMQENTSLKHQFDWFKQQLFGEKSERRQIDNPNLGANSLKSDLDR